MSCTFMNIKQQATVSELESVFQWTSDGAKTLSVPAHPPRSSQFLSKGKQRQHEAQQTKQHWPQKTQTSHFSFASCASYSADSQVAAQTRSSGLCSHPSCFVFFLSASDTESPAGPQRVFFFLRCSCDGLYAQSRFTHLHDCHCSLSLILGSHNLFTVLLIFSASGGVPKSVSRPGSVFFLLTAVCLKTLFFLPLPVFLSLRYSLRCLLDHFIGGHRLLPVSSLAKICSCSSCHQELFSKYSKGIDTTILWTFCFISPQKRSGNSMCKLEENQSCLGSAEVCLTHPGCYFRSILQPVVDFRLLWPGL